MKLIPVFFLLLFSLSTATSALANEAQDIYDFPTTQQQMQFNDLTQKLRCLVCQNETLADSNAPLAHDLRNDIAQMILEGKNNQMIIAFLVDRYGDFVLYQPRLATNTIVLWFTPLVLLIIGIGIAAWVIWQRHRSAREIS